MVTVLYRSCPKVSAHSFTLPGDGSACVFTYAHTDTRATHTHMHIENNSVHTQTPTDTHSETHIIHRVSYIYTWVGIHTDLYPETHTKSYPSSWLGQETKRTLWGLHSCPEGAGRTSWEAHSDPKPPRVLLCEWRRGRGCGWVQAWTGMTLRMETGAVWHHYRFSVGHAFQGSLFQVTTGHRILY